MKVLLLMGSHPRHYYLAQQLKNSGHLIGLVIEKRGKFIPNTPTDLQEIDRTNYIRHFEERNIAEQKHFYPLKEFFELPIIHVDKKQLNSKEVSDFILKHNPNVVLTYGVHKLSNILLDCLPEYAWNIHGGLSPWYRGNTTLFWPFYFLQPNWAGMTIHQLTDKLDGGAILHHSVPELSYGDGIHDVACKAVIKVGSDLIELLNEMDHGFIPTPEPQKSAGKLFLSRDWNPQQLRLIYNTYNNNIVDEFLKGNFPIVEPPLIDWRKNNH